MLVKKKLNNNVVISKDKNQDVILMGKGIGWNARPGDRVDETKIETVFYAIDSPAMEHMAALMAQSTRQEIDLVYSIVRMCMDELEQKDFLQNLFFALLDHLKFAIKRHRQNIDISNPLAFEIRKFYKTEYALGLKALDMIEQELHIRFPEAEAASIALHLMNSQLESGNTTEVMEMTRLTNDIIRLIKYCLNTELNEEAVYYNRFLTHLRYYLIRQIRREQIAEPLYPDLYDSLKSRFLDEYVVVEKLCEYLKEQKGWETSSQEKMYLLIHLANLTSKI